MSELFRLSRPPLMSRPITATPLPVPPNICRHRAQVKERVCCRALSGPLPPTPSPSEGRGGVFAPTDNREWTPPLPSEGEGVGGRERARGEYRAYRSLRRESAVPARLICQPAPRHDPTNAQAPPDTYPAGLAAIKRHYQPIRLRISCTESADLPGQWSRGRCHRSRACKGFP